MPVSFQPSRPPAAPIRIVVVDDSAVMRGLMSGIIARQADMECVGAACDALQAREMIRELDPDVITLDMAMPKMDGLDFLERLMRLRPTPTIMVTSAAQRQPDIVTRALALGAAAVIDKAAVGVPGAFEAFERELLAALRQAVQSRPAAPRRSVPAAPATVSSPALSVASPAPLQAPTSAAPVLSGGPAVEIGERRIRLIAIGASTGGPEATPHVIRALSAQIAALKAQRGQQESGEPAAVSALMKKNAELTAAADAAINRIREGSAQVTAAVATITAAIQEQSNASASVAQGLEKIAGMTERNTTDAQQSAAAAEELNAVAAQLRSTVEQFRV